MSEWKVSERLGFPFEERLNEKTQMIEVRLVMTAFAQVEKDFIDGSDSEVAKHFIKSDLVSRLGQEYLKI